MLDPDDPDDPDDPALERLICTRVMELYADLHAEHPVLDGSLAIPGTFVGQGLGAFVASGMTNDQIVEHVLDIVVRVRQRLTKTQGAGSLIVS